jgi:NTP pyrophosphatase (non-canonical NTP hydrolase)
LQGELGELASLVQKWLWYGKAMTLGDVRQKIKDEAGDVLWYLAELLSAFGLTLEEVMVANVAKLAVRYPDKYTDHHAEESNRDRAAEAAAINQYDLTKSNTLNPVDAILAARVSGGCCEEFRRSKACDCLANAAARDRQERCPHNGEWSLIQVEGSGNGRRCGLCGKVEATT